MEIAGIFVDPVLLAALFAGCLLGGLAKGISGSGLPQIAVPLIALMTDAPTAIAVVQIPTMSINLVQARPRGYPMSAVLPHWPVVVVLFLSTIIGVGLLTVTPPSVLFVLMAGLTSAAAIMLILKPAFVLPARLRLPVGIPIAGVAGITAGMSSLGGPFLIPYLLSLGLPKNLFVAVISLCYLSIILPTITFFLWWEIVPAELFLYSCVAILPALLGMWAGNHLRDRIDEAGFRKVVLAVLVVSAIGLIVKAVQS